MSIFNKIASVFTTIETFVSNLFKSVKEEYLNLEPGAQALFTNLIKWGNLIKKYVTNPSDAGIAGDIIITEAEALLGTSVTGLISSVLSEALIDLGIIQTALTDPSAAYEALLAHLKTFTGSAIGKELFKIIGTIAEKLSGLETNEVFMLIAFVYKTFFQAPAVAAKPVVAPAAPSV